VSVRGAAALIILAVIVSALTGAVAGSLAARGGLPEFSVLPSDLPLPVASPVTSPQPVRNPGNEAIPDAVKTLLPGVVTVINKLPSGEPQGSGSGYVVDAQRGYVLTNSHVITNARNSAPGAAFDAVFADGRTLAARLVGRDPQTDIAVLQVPAQGLTALALGNSDEVPQGAQVIAIGSALGELRNSVTIGVVSAKGRRMPSETRPDLLLEDLIQTDAAISPGNSGGPLIWVATRQVIGMNTLVVREPGAEGLGFAVSANTVRRIADELIKNGAVERGFIGIQYRELTAQIARALSLPAQTTGVVLTSVGAGTPGAAAGLRPNDVLTKVNDQVIDPKHPLATVMLAYRAGDRVRLTVIRDRTQVVVEVALGRAS